jgi:LacI family transcriptional regulator
LGHVHYAFYWLQYLKETGEALAAFEAEVAASGRHTHRMDFPNAHSGQSLDIPREERLRWLAAELKRLPKPIAIMGDDDRRALELLIACDQCGLRVPEDVAILGCDNRTIELGMSRQPLSSVDMNMRGWAAKPPACLMG